jgi:hypothetical protein
MSSSWVEVRHPCADSETGRPCSGRDMDSPARAPCHSDAGPGLTHQRAFLESCRGLSRPTQAAYRFKHQDRMIPTAIIARVTSIQFWTVPPKIVKCRTSQSSIEGCYNEALTRSLQDGRPCGPIVAGDRGGQAGEARQPRPRAPGRACRSAVSGRGAFFGPALRPLGQT